MSVRCKECDMWLYLNDGYLCHSEFIIEIMGDEYCLTCAKKKIDELIKKYGAP